MMKEAKLLNKALYKIELYLLKIMPMVLSLAYLINTVFSYIGISLEMLSHMAGVSFIPLLFMYISSYVFQFCSYHRMFLHYILVNNILNIYDWYIGINLSDRNLFIVYMCITGIFLFLILYFYVRRNKKASA